MAAGDATRDEDLALLCSKQPRCQTTIRGSIDGALQHLIRSHNPTVASMRSVGHAGASMMKVNKEAYLFHSIASRSGTFHGA